MPIGYPYVVDIVFDHKNGTKNQITYNEIYPPIIEKQKIIDSCETSIYQLLEQYSMTNKGKPKSYRVTKKAHVTCLKKFSTNVSGTNLFLCSQSWMENYKNLFALHFWTRKV